MLIDNLSMNMKPHGKLSEVARHPHKRPVVNVESTELIRSSCLQRLQLHPNFPNSASTLLCSVMEDCLVTIFGSGRCQ